MQHNWQAVWDRVVDPAVPLDELTDSELEEVAAIGETRPERLEWAAAVRADDVYAARRARRRAVDPRFAARVERDVAVRRAVRETAGGRMRIPTESEWTERHPDLPRRLYAA